MNVVTQHNDNYRSGANLNETVLTPANVSKDSFGKLYSRPVTGRIFAQPLYVSGVSINGQTKNVVYVATMSNKVYAFDADDTSANAQPLWMVDKFGAPLSYTLFKSPATGGSCNDEGPEVGITSTPVIDPASNTMYLVAKEDLTGAADHSGLVFRIHALDLSTGAEKTGNPMVIQGSVPGSTTDTNGNVTTTVDFQPYWYLNRPALLLENGRLVIAFGSTCDHGDWHGWVMSYQVPDFSSGSDFKQTGVFCSTPVTKPTNKIVEANGKGHFADTAVPELEGMGGIWQGGMGLAADATGVYTIIGNGDVGIKDDSGYDDGNTGKNFGNSFVRLDLGTLNPSDWFTPFNAAHLNMRDQDLGASGPLLLPDALSDKPLVIGGGKQGILYLVDRTNMGKLKVKDVMATLKAAGTAHIDPNEDLQIPQKFEVTERHQGSSFYNIHGAPIYWEGPQGPMIYLWGEEDPLKAYAFKNGKFGGLDGTPGVPAATYDRDSYMHGMPGGMLSISANGKQNGIVWATHLADDPHSQDALLEGQVSAFDANPQNGKLHELWNSGMNSDRDSPGSPGKFAPPTIANGKVFVISNGTDYNKADYFTYRDSALHVYGLLSATGNANGTGTSTDTGSGTSSSTGTSSATGTSTDSTNSNNTNNSDGTNDNSGGANLR